MKKLIPFFVLLIAAGCNTQTATAENSTPKKPVWTEGPETPGIPAPANTAALKWIGFPFDKPLYYQMEGFRGQTMTGSREYKYAAKGDKLVIDATWSGDIGSALGQSEQWSAEAEGIRQTMVQGNAISPAPIYLPADPAPGKTWQTNYSFKSPAGQGTMSVKSQSKVLGMESVETKLGKFDALVLQETGTMTGTGIKAALSGKTWFVEGMGMVKAVQKITNAPQGQKTSEITVTIVAVPKPKE